MSWGSSKSRATHESDEPEQSFESDIDVLPATHELLDLQQAAGNKAVQQIIGSIAVESLPSAGETLPESTRELMESRLGERFDDVRIHIDEEAAARARDVGANAYTIGRDIYFGKGNYAPHDPQGQRLIAHELAHVIQQDHAGNGDRQKISHEDVSHDHAAEREAQTVADATVFANQPQNVTLSAHGIQRDVGWAQRGPLPDPYGEYLILNAFAKKFLEAARLILANPVAMTLVKEADAAGIQFGGYAEEGPGKTLGRAYTSGTSVYVPKTSTDPIMAMRDFLFELNNALRAPKFAALGTEAAKGSGGTLTAKQYAYRMAELEVEGMLRLGQIWFETKKTAPKGSISSAYDAPFFLSDYEAVKDGKKTKDDVVKDVLGRTYETGAIKGKTVEQYYIEAYNRLSGGK